MRERSLNSQCLPDQAWQMCCCLLNWRGEREESERERGKIETETEGMKETLNSVKRERAWISYLGTSSLPGMERGGWDLANSGIFNL